jgi:hypothetical protein
MAPQACCCKWLQTSDSHVAPTVVLLQHSVLLIWLRRPASGLRQQLSFLLDMLQVIAELWLFCSSLSVGSYLCSCNRGYEAVPLDGLNSTLVSKIVEVHIRLVLYVCTYVNEFMLQTKRWLVRGSNVISAPWERYICLLRAVTSFITLQTKRAISDDFWHWYKHTGNSFDPDWHVIVCYLQEELPDWLKSCRDINEWYI